MHNISLITTIAAGFTAAWLLGLATHRLRLSPIVGYLLGGVLIGPFSPGYVGDGAIAQQLAEVGVILLMFGVGLHFHVKDLLAVKAVAIPGAVGQSLVATLLGVVIFAALGLSYKAGFVIGLALAVASTVVLMRVLMDAGILESAAGHVAVGWLLVEDIFTVIVLVLIPVLGEGHLAGVATSAPAAAAASVPAVATGGGLLVSLGWALVKLTAMVGVILVGGSRVIPWILVQVARLNSRELFTLTVLVFSIAIAVAAYKVFDASMALGAFLAGMVVAQSPVSHQAAADALPMRDAFAVLFFVSVGMLFDPAALMLHPMMVVSALGIILIAKPLSALAIVAALGHSSRTALTVALGLAQVGEFSFILSELAHAHGLMPDSGRHVLVAAAIITITLNPMLFRSLDRIEAFLKKRPRLWALLNRRCEQAISRTNAEAAATISASSEEEARLAVVVGYGPVGRSVDHLLRESGLRVVIVDLNMDTISELTRAGRTAIFGNASHEAVLEQAGVRKAAYLILTLPQAGERAAVVSAGRNLNPSIRVLVRARYLRERLELEQAGAAAAVFEEAEAAVGLARLVLADTGASRDVIDRSIKDLRLRLIFENVSNLGAQTLRHVMVPWSRVARLSNGDSLDAILRRISTQHYSRWPVLDAQTGRPIGYLLAKDLVSGGETGGSDWTGLIRPIRLVHVDDNMASVLLQLQRERATVCIVEEGGQPVGLITIEDILEQVVGRLEDEYPRRPRVLLRDAILRGGVVLSVSGRTPAEAIAELAAAIPGSSLPEGADVAGEAIAREHDMPTDVGFGVAIPHARCPGLAEPLVVFGRSSEGVLFRPTAAEPVRLMFLLVTPKEQPDLQVLLLGQLAAVAGNAAVRRDLMAAQSANEVRDRIASADPAANEKR